MNILHLTDLHFNSESYEKFTQHDMIEKLLIYLTELDKKVDIVIFSGDLVYKGDNIEDVRNAKIVFLDKLCKKLKISKEDIIWCAGNHDMNRSFKSEGLEERFDSKINDSDSLHYLFNKKDYDYQTALNTTSNYNNFIKGFYQDIDNVETSEL